jgi:hypothetical protein
MDFKSTFPLSDDVLGLQQLAAAFVAMAYNDSKAAASCCSPRIFRFTKYDDILDWAEKNS